MHLILVLQYNLKFNKRKWIEEEARKLNKVGNTALFIIDFFMLKWNMRDTECKNIDVISKL